MPGSVCQRIFYEGQVFKSAKELFEAKSLYEQQAFVELWKEDARTLAAAAKRAPRRVLSANPALKYYSVKLCCKFAGEPRKRDRIRKTTSFRQGCPCMIYMSSSEDGQALVVRKFVENHNHMVTSELFSHLPRQRKPDFNTSELLKSALALKSNNKLLQQKVESSTGKKMTLKDIANIKQSLRGMVNGNEIESVVLNLRKKDGSIVEVIVSEEQEFRGLVFQDGYMRRMYNAFPEIILVDATYKLLELRLSVYLIVGIDGDGLTEVFAVILLADESVAAIEAALAKLREHTTCWTRTQVIMSDKDFAERDAFSKCFPDAKLLICLIHALRSFRREITCERMGIDGAQRDMCLQIVQDMVNARSSGQYEKLVHKLRDTKLGQVVDYFMDNWDSIKEQWVPYYKNTILNYGETTNNRIESTFSKIKSVCSNYGSLIQFFDEFYSALQCLRNDQNHHFLMSASKKETNVHAFSEEERLYSDFITPYAFNFVVKQLQKIRSVASFYATPDGDNLVSSSDKTCVYHVTAAKCTCSFFTSMGLPCKHVLKLRLEQGLSLFAPALVLERWTKKLYLSTFESRFPSSATPVAEGNEIMENCVGSCVSMMQPRKSPRVLSQAQKYQRLMNVGRTLASVGSEGGMMDYDKKLKLLQTILSAWQSGCEVTLSDEIGQSKDAISLEADENSNVEAIEGYVSSLDDLASAVSSVEYESFEVVEVLSSDELLGAGQFVNNFGISAVASSCLIGEKAPESTKSVSLDNIKMPQKIKTKGRPKGADTTVIGLPRKNIKRPRTKPVAFSRLPYNEKLRVLMECVVSPVCAQQVLEGKMLIEVKDLETNMHEIPDTIRDEDNVDMQYLEKYFTSNAWIFLLKLLSAKKQCKWTCGTCKHVLGEWQSLICDRCLLWFHLDCTNLKKAPKAQSWFCFDCNSKYGGHKKNR